MDYAEARRRARTILGAHSDVEWVVSSPFPARVGVWMKAEGNTPARFIYVGIGSSFEEALEDAKRRQL